MKEDLNKALSPSTKYLHLVHSAIFLPVCLDHCAHSLKKNKNKKNQMKQECKTCIFSDAHKAGRKQAWCQKDAKL